MSHNPENPSQRSVEPIAGGPEFVALNFEAVTGGRTHNLPRERHGTLHGNTQRRRIHRHVEFTSHIPSNVINMSQIGGPRGTVKEILLQGDPE